MLWWLSIFVHSVPSAWLAFLILDVIFLSRDDDDYDADDAASVDDDDDDDDDGDDCYRHNFILCFIHLQVEKKNILISLLFPLMASISCFLAAMGI